jgi:serine/threonine protein kinase
MDETTNVVTYEDENENKYTFHHIDTLYEQYKKQTIMHHDVDVNIILIQNEETQEKLILKAYECRSSSNGAISFEMAVKESRFLKMLSNVPNIVSFKGLYYKKNKYYDFYDGGSEITYTAYIAQEYVDGTSLDDIILKTGAMNEKKIHTYATQLVSGLLILKEQKVLHKDFGMHNVMICKKNDKIKIIDFGCSAERPKDSVHFDKKAIGYNCDIMSEYNHLAPELGNESTCEITRTLGLQYPITLQADVWSFGCILYRLVTGKKSPSITLNKTKTGIKFSFASPKWKSISPSLKKLIKKCLVYDPAKRISIEEVAEDPWILQNFFRRA